MDVFPPWGVPRLQVPELIPGRRPGVSYEISHRAVWHLHVHLAARRCSLLWRKLGWLSSPIHTWPINACVHIIYADFTTHTCACIYTNTLIHTHLQGHAVYTHTGPNLMINFRKIFLRNALSRPADWVRFFAHYYIHTYIICSKEVLNSYYCVALGSTDEAGAPKQASEEGSQVHPLYQ